MSRLKLIIERYKNFRKRAYIVSGGKKKYAFVGLGTHSIQNLYPVIHYLRLPLKYIVTKSPSNAELIDRHFPDSIGTSNLDRVLNDEEISGVFISASPSAHYELVKKVLKSDKNVFVEKPPCLSLDELNDLIAIEKNASGTCLVGLQKQYAPCNLMLKKKIGKNASYNYRFVTGPYPEGDALPDLFIHPISLAGFLFGEINTANILVKRSKKNITLFLQLQHKDDIAGSIELSTNYSWQNAHEKLVVNSANGIYETTNTEELTVAPVSGTVLGIPLEKVIKRKNTRTVLHRRNNFPASLYNNQLYTSGYFNEIETFAKICETGNGSNNSSISSCLMAYNLIFKIKKMYHV